MKPLMKKLTSLLLITAAMLMMCSCRKAAATNIDIITEETQLTVETEIMEETAEDSTAAIEVPPMTEETVEESETKETESSALASVDHIHQWTEKVTKPTCTEAGFTTHTCKCGEEYEDSRVDATGHTWGSWKTVTEATETSAGKAERTCSGCGEVESRILDKLPANHKHSYTSTITVQPTCSKIGVKTFSCSCGNQYTENIAKLDHRYTSEAVAATCTLRGYTLYTCSACGNSYKDDYKPVADHSYNTAVTAPSCTERGYTTYNCKNCSESYVGDYVSAKGHTWGSWKVTKEATESNTGIKERTCSNCKKVETETIPKIEHTHSMTHIVTKPTCTTDGYTTHKCSTCSYSYTDSKVSKNGHSWGDWNTIIAPTEDSTGRAARTCSACGASESKTLDKIPASHSHNYSTVVESVAATCDKEGYVKKSCSCGNVKTEVISATGHNWEHHHEEEIGHYDVRIACHCGWSCSASGDYISAFAAHVESVDPETRYDHSYFEKTTWIVDTPAKDWYECTVCGKTK